ncbi:M48 family metalloprotease [Micromonospora sp. NPDC050397]|uniref:M48 family metalloprotease n=1 Tax=Micromonospora sp. NPDC050397 TaxID=3364279 RepID=UPI0038516934
MTAPAGPPPARLGWTYLLVVAALSAIGISAGDIYFLADRSLHLPWALAVDECERMLAAVEPERASAVLAECLAPVPRQRGLVMLGGAGVVLACALLLLLLVPLLDRWRLRRERDRFDVPGAVARFDALCDRDRLVGRHRPRLLIVGPPFRQAFTTGMPGRRPLVVLPAAVAVAYRDPDRFDPVVQHELAHVRAGDVTLVSAVRGLVWLPVPAVAVGALVEVFSFGPNELLARALLRALLLSVLVAVLGALLMRVREREADLHVVRAGHGRALAALLRRAGEQTAPPESRLLAFLRRAFARHPGPAERGDSLERPGRLREGGLAQALAVATVAVVAMVAAFEVTSELRPPARGWLPALVAVWTGATLLGGALMPSLVRRAEAARRTAREADWWRPVAGAAAGFFVSVLVAVWFPVPGGMGLFLIRDGGASLATAILAMTLGTGAVGLCVVLATALARTADTGSARWRYLGYLAAVGVTASVLWPLPVVAAVQHDPEALWAWLVYALPRSGWLLPALALPALLAACRWFTDRPSGPATAPTMFRSVPARAVALAVLVCGGGAVLHTRLDPPGTLAESLRALQSRWLLCALAGLLVLLVTAAYARQRHLLGPLLAAGTATALAALVPYLHALVTGGAAGPEALRLHLVAPLVWLLYLVAVTVPALLLRPVGRNPEPEPEPELASARPAALSRIASLTRVALPAAVLTVVVLGPVAPRLYTPLPVRGGVAGAVDAGSVPRPERSFVVGPATSATTTPPVPMPTAAATPAAGRPLGDAETRAVAGAVRAAVPDSWTVRASGTGGESRIEPAACRPLATDAYLGAIKPGVRSSAKAGYASPRGRVGVASTTLDVTVTSYAEPVPRSVFDAADAARAACQRFSSAGAGGSLVHFTVGARPAPLLGEQSWRVDYALSAGSGQGRISGDSAFVLVRIGHNLVTVYLSAVMEPLDERILGAALTAAVTALDPP